MSYNPVLLNMTAQRWHALMKVLADAGAGERESGAFLLGRQLKGQREVHNWLPYHLADPTSLNYDYVRLGPAAFSRLWERCQILELEVVADIHTHPRGPQQSPSDRAHPMIAIAGHLALIAPHFAQGVIGTDAISVNRYLGSGRWESFLGQAAAARIHLEAAVER